MLARSAVLGMGPGGGGGVVRGGVAALLLAGGFVRRSG